MSHHLKADAPGSNLSEPFQALFDAVDWEKIEHGRRLHEHDCVFGLVIRKCCFSLSQEHLGSVCIADF